MRVSEQPSAGRQDVADPGIALGWGRMGPHGAVGAHPGMPWGAWGPVCVALQMSWGMNTLSPLAASDCSFRNMFQFVASGRLIRGSTAGGF